MATFILYGIAILGLAASFFKDRKKTLVAALFVGAWSTTKIPVLFFDMVALGTRFTLLRLAIDIVGVIIIAWAIKGLVSHKEIDRLHEKAGGNTLTRSVGRFS
jgi:uncharacterized membrane protein YraQ (UPF0718 family)